MDDGPGKLRRFALQFPGPSPVSFGTEKMMKKYLIVIAVIAGMVSFFGLGYARSIRWQDTEEPPVKLTEAVQIAQKQLVAKDNKGFYCLQAWIAKTLSEGDWVLRFGSKSGKVLWVKVTSDKRVFVSKDGFPDY